MNIFLFVLLFLLCALRSFNIGTDTEQYLYIYQHQLNSFRNPLEFLFIWISIFSKNLFDSERVYIVMLSLCNYIPFIYILSKQCKKYVPWAILLFLVSPELYFLESFNILRQSIATSFLLIVYYHIYHKNSPFKIILFSIIAIGFHSSSILYLLVVLLSKIKISYTFVVSAVLVTMLLAFSQMLSKGVIMILENSSFLDLLGISQYKFFITNNLVQIRNAKGLLTLIVPHCFLSIYSFKKLEGNLYSRIYFWGVIILNFVSFFNFAGRISMGLLVVELFLIPQLIEKNPQKLLVIFGYFIYLIFFHILFLARGGAELANLIPYSFF